MTTGVMRRGDSFGTSCRSARTPPEDAPMAMTLISTSASTIDSAQTYAARAQRATRVPHREPRARVCAVWPIMPSPLH